MGSAYLHELLAALGRSSAFCFTSGAFLGSKDLAGMWKLN